MVNYSPPFMLTLNSAQMDPLHVQMPAGPKMETCSTKKCIINVENCYMGPKFYAGALISVPICKKLSSIIVYT
jgi:hypothetical protein